MIFTRLINQMLNCNHSDGLRLEHLQILQLVAQQVVFSLEDINIGGAQKKSLAMANVKELFWELGYEAPDELVDLSVEVGVRLARCLQRVAAG